MFGNPIRFKNIFMRITHKVNLIWPQWTHLNDGSWEVKNSFLCILNGAIVPHLKCRSFWCFSVSLPFLFSDAKNETRVMIFVYIGKIIIVLYVDYVMTGDLLCFMYFFVVAKKSSVIAIENQEMFLSIFFKIFKYFFGWKNIKKLLQETFFHLWSQKKIKL